MKTDISSHSELRAYEASVNRKTQRATRPRQFLALLVALLVLAWAQVAGAQIFRGTSTPTSTLVKQKPTMSIHRLTQVHEGVPTVGYYKTDPNLGRFNQQTQIFDFAPANEMVYGLARHLGWTEGNIVVVPAEYYPRGFGVVGEQGPAHLAPGFLQPGAMATDPVVIARQMFGIGAKELPSTAQINHVLGMPEYQQATHTHMLMRTLLGGADANIANIGLRQMPSGKQQLVVFDNGDLFLTPHWQEQMGVQRGIFDFYNLPDASHIRQPYVGNPRLAYPEYIAGIRKLAGAKSSEIMGWMGMDPNGGPLNGYRGTPQQIARRLRDMARMQLHEFDGTTFNWGTPSQF